MAYLFILIISPCALANIISPCALAKKWLFWLCEASVLRVGVKPNVPLAGRLMIVFKKRVDQK
jgi:hypothetical protein